MKQVKNLVLGLILLALVAAGVYYFWFKKQAGPANTVTDFFEFKVVKTDLADWEIQKYTEEFETLKTNLQEQPDQLDGWLSLGMIKKYLGDYTGAEAAWLHVNEIRPGNSISFANLADLYTNFTKEYDKAVPMYEKAISNSMGEEKNVLFYRNFYYFYRDYVKDNAKAENILLEGIQNNPQFSDLYALLGGFYRDNEQTDKALEYFKKALELNPESTAVKKAIQELQK